MTNPVVVRPVRQHTPYTCTIASLAALIHRDYEDVYDYAVRIYTDITGGLYTTEVKRVARHFKATLLYHRKWTEAAGDTGLLLVSFRERQTNHMVLLFNGVVYDPQEGQLWEPDAYLASGRNGRWAGLLTLADHEGDTSQ